MRFHIAFVVRCKISSKNLLESEACKILRQSLTKFILFRYHFRMRFLIVKTSAIGDIIHSFPVVEYLHARFPGAQIDWVVEKAYEDLVAAHPLIHKVFTISSKKWRGAFHRFSTWKEIRELRSSLSSYDILFDLQGNTKSALVTAIVKAKEKVGFGWKTAAEKLNLLATRSRYDVSRAMSAQQRYLKLVQSHFGDETLFEPQGACLKLKKEEEERISSLLHASSPRYMVAFGSKWRNKKVSEETLKGFLHLVNEEAHPHFFFIFSGEEEKKVAEELHALFPENSLTVGNLTLPLWQGLMHHMDLVIAMDSAALHLCGTTKTPSFSVFGPSNASVFKPLGSQHTHFQRSCPYGRTFVERCPILRSCPTGACIRDVSAEELFQAFRIHSTI